MMIREMLAEIGLSDPYVAIDVSRDALDIQGWGSEHPWFQSLVDEIKPRQIVEVGTWKGASAIQMARSALRFDPAVVVLCVDTWLGSNTFWCDPHLRPLLRLENGYPTLYRQFLSNIIIERLTDTVKPFPMTSISAAKVLARYRIEADLIYIDAAHSEYEVYGDLMHFWPVLRDGGVMFGDDYCDVWPGVVTAVDRFAHERQLRVEASAEKWLLRKPAAMSIV